MKRKGCKECLQRIQDRESVLPESFFLSLKDIVKVHGRKKALILILNSAFKMILRSGNQGESIWNAIPLGFARNVYKILPAFVDETDTIFGLKARTAQYDR